MKFKDDRIGALTEFEKLKIGDGFEYEDILFIKISATEAFDVCNNRIEDFCGVSGLELRECEITFY